MDFFEKLGKKATETFNSAAEKTNKIASETKIKLKINDCKSKIKDLYQDIGKVVYQKFVLDGNLEVKEDIEEQLSKISELTNQIEECEKQILELANMKQCVNCKNKIERNAKFCQECGAEQPAEEVHEVEVVDNGENEVSPENGEESENVAENVASEEGENNNEENRDSAEDVKEDVAKEVEEAVEENVEEEKKGE